MRGREGLPVWAANVLPFAVTLEIEDAPVLRKLVSEWLFKAREKKFGART
jgi:tetraacyldisaccharide 4'-kinase